LNYYEYLIKGVSLDALKTDAEFKLRKLSKEDDQERELLKHKLEMEFEKLTFDNEIDNLDDSVLRYRAFENVRTAMNYRKVTVRSSL